MTREKKRAKAMLVSLKNELSAGKDLSKSASLRFSRDLPMRSIWNHSWHCLGNLILFEDQETQRLATIHCASGREER